METKMMIGQFRALKVFVSLLYAVTILIGIGLVGDGGGWYLANPHHRTQVDALLRGELALAYSPAGLEFDLAWNGKSVQQVWGLGVPIWKAVFVGLTRLFGLPDFPDIGAFGIALCLTAHYALGTFFNKRFPKSNQAKRFSYIQPVGSLVVILVFPPFLTLLCSNLEVYEETVAYASLFGILQLCALVRLILDSTAWRFFVLCLLCGGGALIRPPLIFYGFFGVMAGGVVVWYCYQPSECLLSPVISRSRLLVAGAAVFCVGVSSLLITNYLRFGSCLEFGHALNVQHLNSLTYSTRFGGPFTREPPQAALRELGGLLFARQNNSRGDYHRQNIFHGQSPTVRWRDIYLNAYDSTYLWSIILSAALTAFYGLKFVRHRHQSGKDCFDTVFFLATGLFAWMSITALAYFYLRLPIISSRYLLDFIPGFLALNLIVWTWILRVAPVCCGPRCWLLAAAVLGLWTGSRLIQPPLSPGNPQRLTWAQVRGSLGGTIRDETPQELPLSYDRPSSPHMTGIPYNGTGWDSSNGFVKPLVTVFVDSPSYLELWISAKPDHPIKESVREIRAKIGLEEVAISSVQKLGGMWRIRFNPPERSIYKTGTQIVFIAFVSDQYLHHGDTPYTLHGVRWR